MSGPDLLKPRHSERELTSGKVPLSPIIRAGYLVLGAIFLGFTCVVAAGTISSVVHESWWIKCLVGVVIGGWFLIFIAFGRRLLWAALTAPRQHDEDEDVESAASDQRNSN
jgi:hypothetical protein